MTYGVDAAVFDRMAPVFRRWDTPTRCTSHSEEEQVFLTSSPAIFLLKVTSKTKIELITVANSVHVVREE